MHLTPIDLLLGGIAVYLLVSYLRRKRSGGRPRKTLRPPIDLQQHRNNQQDEEDPQRQAADAYKRAQQAWDALRTQPPQQTETPQQQQPVVDVAYVPGQDARTITAPGAADTVPDGFDEDEFMRGAKLFFQRVRDSWDARDLDDLSQFCTPDALAEFQRRAEAQTRPPSTRTTLVSAGLVEVRVREDSLEEASVYYEARLYPQAGSAESKDFKEIWQMVRNPAQSGSSWKLDRSRPVETTEAMHQ